MEKQCLDSGIYNKLYCFKMILQLTNQRQYEQDLYYGEGMKVLSSCGRKLGVS